MMDIGLSKKIMFVTIQRKEFHFRVDVCTKMTVNRVHRQPEFEKKHIVKMICDESSITLFEKMCKLSGLR